MKILGIGSWVSNEWCEKHYCGSTNMVVRLSDVKSQKNIYVFILLIQGQIPEIFVKMYLELVELENDIFFGYWVFHANTLFFPNENLHGFHMSSHLFLHYRWFLQNLGKDLIQTNMHTTIWLTIEYDVLLRIGFFWSHLVTLSQFSRVRGRGRKGQGSLS